MFDTHFEPGIGNKWNIYRCISCRILWEHIYGYLAFIHRYRFIRFDFQYHNPWSFEVYVYSLYCHKCTRSYHLLPVVKLTMVQYSVTYRSKSITHGNIHQCFLKCLVKGIDLVVKLVISKSI